MGILLPSNLLNIRNYNNNYYVGYSSVFEHLFLIVLEAKNCEIKGPEAAMGFLGESHHGEKQKYKRQRCEYVSIFSLLYTHDSELT